MKGGADEAYNRPINPCLIQSTLKAPSGIKRDT